MIKTIVRAIFGLISIGAAAYGVFLLATATAATGSFGDLRYTIADSNGIFLGVGWLLVGIFLQLLIIADRLGDKSHIDEIADGMNSVQSSVKTIGVMLKHYFSQKKP